MPRIPDEALDVAIYCYRSEEDAQAGRRSGGSGFLVLVPATSPEPLTVEPILPQQIWIGAARDIGPLHYRWFCYAVTCWHVAEAAPVIRINTRDAGHDIISLTPSDWHHHATSDLAVTLIDIKPKHHAALTVPIEMLLLPVESDMLDVGIGDNIYSVGRFINHEGTQTNRPVVRFGNISVMPGDPVFVKGVGPQEAYLIETRTIPGYSGSPVFLEVPPWELNTEPSGTERRILGDRQIPFVKLLGVAGGYLMGRNEAINVQVGGKTLQGYRAEPNTGMMWCIPAWKLMELLNRADLRAQRDAQRREWEESPPAGAPGC
jgi:hypothetical protein